MFPQSLFRAKRKKIIKTVQLKIVIFTAVNITVYCIGMLSSCKRQCFSRTCLSVSGSCYGDRGFRV